MRKVLRVHRSNSDEDSAGVIGLLTDAIVAGQVQHSSAHLNGSVQGQEGKERGQGGERSLPAIMEIAVCFSELLTRNRRPCSQQLQPIGRVV